MNDTYGAGLQDPAPSTSVEHNQNAGHFSASDAPEATFNCTEAKLLLNQYAMIQEKWDNMRKDFLKAADERLTCALCHEFHGYDHDWKELFSGLVEMDFGAETLSGEIDGTKKGITLETVNAWLKKWDLMEEMYDKECKGSGCRQWEEGFVQTQQPEIDNKPDRIRRVNCDWMIQGTQAATSTDTSGWNTVDRSNGSRGSDRAQGGRGGGGGARGGRSGGAIGARDGGTRLCFNYNQPGHDRAIPKHFARHLGQTDDLVNMISILSIKLLPLLHTLLDFEDIETEDKENSDTFRPSPEVQTTPAPSTFAQVFQKSSELHGGYETRGLTELYKQWNAEIIKMMEVYDNRQKCQNCHESHECQNTAVQWIKWHSMMLRLKVESVDEAAFKILAILPRIIESEYHQRVSGTACRKSKQMRAKRSGERDAGNDRIDPETETEKCGEAYVKDAAGMKDI
ncbi:uncharacterized protein LY89DRAFT_741759 [Mollisia scopiformis]|uniref:Uncharacterized protein n=1 Tax=Mollisia scopiformis TaxID=149040 RepID=A0A132B8R8_MOLSC|nr:uncharacterized protein LY89DRAFT_741759 [Mollisia scopiformis]KUJ08389.1 hypothetical protein LY89DRAFT_741759 [Mollisia scopiformis]